MHVVLLQHGEVSLVRLRPIWMTNHPPPVLRHRWLGHQTCENILSIMTHNVFSVMLTPKCLVNTDRYY